MIEINNCPITGLERKVINTNVLFYNTFKQVKLECVIAHFKDGEQINNSRIRNYLVTLVADNNKLVDIKTGELVESFELKNSIGQFDYFERLQKEPIVQYDMIQKYVKQANDNLKFDI